MYSMVVPRPTAYIDSEFSSCPPPFDTSYPANSMRTYLSCPLLSLKFVPPA